MSVKRSGPSRLYRFATDVQYYGQTEEFSEARWEALEKVHHAGRRGIPSNGCDYPLAGEWNVLCWLKKHDPPLAREVFRLSKHGEPSYWFVITEAGREYYSANLRAHQHARRRS